MAKTKTMRTRTDRYVEEHELKDLDRDYICACMALLQGRKEQLQRIELECAGVDEEIVEIDDTIKAFAEELNSRDG